MTLTFLRLGKITRGDALCYVVAQFVGGVAGIARRATAAAALDRRIRGELRRDPARSVGHGRRVRRPKPRSRS